MERLSECEIVTPTRRRWMLNYYITQCTGNSISLRSDQLERRSWIEVHVPERLGHQAPAWAAHENGEETRLWPIDSGSICCSSVRSPTSSQTQPFQIKWEVYFSKELCRLSLLCRRYDFACICIMCYTTKDFRGNTTVCRFLLSFRCYTQRKDGSNTIWILSCCSNNDVLNGSLARWRHRLLRHRHCCLST